MNFKTIALTAALSTTLIGCANQQEKITSNIGLPNWVVAPNIDNGLAESACVPYSGHFSIDRAQATALARNALTEQIEVRAASLTKTHLSKTDTVGGSSIGADFESSARQIAEATLKGTKADKADIFTIDEKKQFCVLVTLAERETDDVAQQIITASGAKLSSEDKEVLAEQFKANEGQEELKGVIESM